MSYTLLNGNCVLRNDDQVIIPDDPLNVEWIVYQAWLAAGNVPGPVPTDPPPPRRATLSALLNPLSSAQRASITLDHWMRLQAEASAAADGTVFVGNSKLERAAGDLGMTPDAWFALAGG